MVKNKPYYEITFWDIWKNMSRRDQVFGNSKLWVNMWKKYKYIIPDNSFFSYAFNSNFNIIKVSISFNGKNSCFSFNLRTNVWLCIN